MNKTTVIIVSALGAGLIVGIAVGGRLMNPAEAQAPATSFSAVAGAIGEQDISGPYQVQQGWPKDLATLPDHDNNLALGILVPGKTAMNTVFFS